MIRLYDKDDHYILGDKKVLKSSTDGMTLELLIGIRFKGRKMGRFCLIDDKHPVISDILKQKGDKT